MESSCREHVGIVIKVSDKRCFRQPFKHISIITGASSRRMEIVLSTGESETHGTTEQQGVDIEVVDQRISVFLNEA